jgi:hypothetical protein
MSRLINNYMPLYNKFKTALLNSTSQEHREEINNREEIIKNSIGEVCIGRYNCSRVWEAWQYGTMKEDDFSPLEEDENFYEEIIEILGRDITLEDVLRALNDKLLLSGRPDILLAINNNGEFLKCFDDGYKVIGINWQLGLPAHLQKDEVLEELIKLL